MLWTEWYLHKIHTLALNPNVMLFGDVGITFCRSGDSGPERAGFYPKWQASSRDKNPGPWAPSAVPVQYARRLPGTLQIKTIMLLLKYLLA